MELAVDIFFPQPYGTFKQRGILETDHFYNIAHRTKNVIFDDIIEIREEPYLS